MRLVILVVDDERPILEIFARAIRPRHEVILESNGHRALDILLGEREIDVTFLDMMMPDMSGAEMLRELRENAPARLERLVIATGAMGIPGIEELLDEYRIPVTGARLPILEKPYDIEAIEIMLRRFVMCFAPKGPWYPKPRVIAPSRPDLIDDDMEETTAVTALARRAQDPKTKTSPLEAVAAAVVDLRAQHGAVETRLVSVEAHFENNPTTKKLGMVAEMYKDFEFIRRSISLWPRAFGAVVAALTVLGAIATWWLAAHQPQARDVARELRAMEREQSAPTSTAQPK